MDRTYSHMKNWYFGKRIWCNTQPYVLGFNLCHRTNYQSSKPIGLLQPRPIAKCQWERIGIEFITDLPTSGNGNHCIETFVNHMTKIAHWHARERTIDAMANALIYIDDIARLDGVPQEVVSDRDVHLATEYSRQFARILQAKLLMSMALHPETDGLSEN